MGTAPPSTAQAAPVTFEARSEQRNAITAAISSSVPMRPSGGLDRVASSTSSRGLAGALRDLVGQAAVALPQLALDGTRRHRVDEHALRGEGVGEHPAQRQLRPPS